MFLSLHNPKLISSARTTITFDIHQRSKEDLPADSCDDRYISLWYVPHCYARVVFIPKGGKHGHDSVKDVRLISLTSVLFKTLRILHRSRVKAVATTDDLVILVSGMFFSVMSDIMKGALVSAFRKLRTRHKPGQNCANTIHNQDKGIWIPPPPRWAKNCSFL